MSDFTPPSDPGQGPTPPQPSDWGQPQQPSYEYGHEYGSGYGYGAPAYRQSQATAALVLAIVGLLCCGPLALAGMIMGRSEMNAIERGEIHPSSRGTAQGAFIVGLIAVVIWVGFMSLYALFILLSLGASL